MVKGKAEQATDEARIESVGVMVGLPGSDRTGVVGALPHELSQVVVVEDVGSSCSSDVTDDERIESAYPY